ncbi:MAG: 3alpha(or 20beta)-hydroxysteroid dehydrogenase [Mycobacterium sp.]|jgi:3alpha(or 20beta)-hydroxysteroid dehydrogenase|nr:3alpha(or 20beta)-hydroxysteroid dehydrogenase [Mycobacterium sp.]
MSRFDGQVVFVTGGSRGMGAAHCRGFHAEGAKVVIADVLEPEGKALAGELGDGALFFALDVTDRDAWRVAVETAEHAFGPVSVLINNAAIIEPDLTLIEHRDPEQWHRVVDVNLFGTFLGIQSIIPSMRRAGGGAIVNISSVGGFMATAGHSGYCASKWGVRALTKAAALELGRDNIRVNSVHPGTTNTAMHASAASPVAGQPKPDLYRQLAIPRVAEPDEVTRMVMFVASKEASYSTGSEFIVDGGYLLGAAIPAGDG